MKFDEANLHLKEEIHSYWLIYKNVHVQLQTIYFGLHSAGRLREVPARNRAGFQTIVALGKSIELHLTAAWIPIVPSEARVAGEVAELHLGQRLNGEYLVQPNNSQFSSDDVPDYG